jgi:phosphoglycolate phosphatase
VAFELVIFDCDGVLVDSEPVGNRVLAGLLSEIGLPTSIDEAVRDYMGRSVESCLEIIEAKLGRPVPVEFSETLTRRTFAALRDELQAVPGIERALDRIALPTCVASSGPHDKMRLTLGLTGLLPRLRTSGAASRARTCSCTRRPRSTSPRSTAPWSKTASSASERGGQRA